MKSPFPERYWTRASIEFLSEKFDHPISEYEQDWAYTVADFGRLDAYMSVFRERSINDDIRFTLADMIIQAFEDEGDLAADPRWVEFLAHVSADFRIHAHQVWYWAATDTPLADSWKVSPWMRELLREKSPG